MKIKKGWTIIVVAVLLAAVILYLGLWPIPPELPPQLVQSHPSEKALCPIRSQAGPVSQQTYTVQPGQSIQAALDQAHSGDTILVMPGTYHEQVMIAMDQITLRGQSQGSQRPLLDGENKLENGFMGCANQLTIENFDIKNYQKNGVIAEDADSVTLRNIFTDHTGAYGLFPVRSKNILVDGCIATGATDTGIYIGQSRDIVVRNSEAYANVSGIEIENSIHALVQNNYSHGNTAGLLMFVLPDLSVNETSQNRIIENRLIGNNLANFADKDDIVSNIPSGTGLLVVGTKNNEIARNDIEDNRSVGIGLVDLRPFFPDHSAFDIETAPRDNWIHDNKVTNNGTNPDEIAKKTGLPGVDLLWDGSGWHNSWSEIATKRFPPVLPGRDWNDFMRRFYYRLITLLKRFI